MTTLCCTPAVISICHWVHLERSRGGVSDSFFGFGASVQVTSNGEGGSDCMPPASFISRNVEEIDVIYTTQDADAEKTVDELAVNQSGATLTGDSVEAIDQEQALPQICGIDANSC